MGDSSTQICRLCLEITPSCESKPIKDVKKETLQVLPFNIYFYTSISGDAVACKRCLETLQDWFDFKARCSNTMNVNFKTAIKAKCLHLMSSGSTCQKNSNGCWLCTSSIEVEAFNRTTDQKELLLIDMIENCFPKVYLNTGHRILLCQPCLTNIKKYYTFMKTCQKVEQRIEHFRELSPHDTVILEDVLNFKEDNVVDRPLIIKKECLDVDNENAMKCLENEEVANIKCEEIDIKDELDAEVTQNSHQSDDGDSFIEAGLLKTTGKEKNHSCPKCPYSTKTLSHFKRHIQIHSDNKQHCCTLCSFVTDAKLLLRDHMTSHGGATKKHSCRECSYETDRKSHLIRHIIKHKNLSEVDVHKCLLCPFESKYKESLARHHKRWHNKIMKMYKCRECSFSIKTCSVKHHLVHEGTKVVNIFKCKKCPFRTKWQGALQNHRRCHLPKRTYSCNQCSHSTNYLRHLQRHQLVHQADGERQMYKCNLCSYQAKCFSSVKIHRMKTHTDPSHLPKLKCAHCSYETIVKSYLSSHIKVRHGNQPLKCKVCEFRTCKKSLLKQHQLTHMELGEAMSYYCTMCNFKTKYKHSLKYHVKSCAKRKRISDAETLQ